MFPIIVRDVVECEFGFGDLRRRDYLTDDDNANDQDDYLQ